MSITSYWPLALLCLLTFRSGPEMPAGDKDHVLTAVDGTFPFSLVQLKYTLLREPSLNPEAFRLGLLGYYSLRSKDMVSNDSLLTIIDYSMPSTDERFFVINLRRNRVEYKSLVSHGRNSGDLYAGRFSNRKQSHQSPLGFFLTDETYRGGQGYSLLLNGVDTGYNDLSRPRGIVIHGAAYATRDYISRYGRLGRSFGCPALPPGISTRVIDLIRHGSVLFSYFPDPGYIRNTKILHQRSDRL